jgi:NADPH-dependent 2,4-dienoyl-CoA reductase/sulfur reductase-like enzyme
MKTVIVGGVAAGAGVAARLRRLDESAEIMMFERGNAFISLRDVLTYHDFMIYTPAFFNAREVIF